MVEMGGENAKQIIEELNRRGYLYVSDIGNGTFSKVVRVKDIQRNCFVACKISVNCEMAEREAKLLQQLQHPLFPKYKGCWKYDNRHYLLMEDIAGSNVRELLRRRGHFSQKQAVHIALALAQGICFLHERSEPILFRDIKPENVMLRQDGSVKLVDVGCACRKAQSGNIAGSRGYGAPEQFRTREYAGEESDVYALGKLLFYMLTGIELNGQDALLYIAKVYKKKVAPGLLQLMVQATETERNKRIPDMRSFWHELIIYAGRPTWKSVSTDVKAYLCGGPVVDFYYVQNVRKGLGDSL